MSRFGFPGTNNSNLGLGSAGGPKGVAAGITQVLVNFVMQYDAAALKRISSDLAKNDAARKANAAQIATATRQQQALEAQSAKAQLARNNLSATAVASYKNLVAAQKQANLEEAAYGRVSMAGTANLLAREAAFKAQSGLSRELTLSLVNQDGTLQQIKLNHEQIAALLEQETNLNGENAALERERSTISSKAGAAGQRVGSLLLGLTAATVGGQIISAAFMEPIQQGLEGISKAFDAMVNPGKAAAAATSDVASALEKVKSASGSLDFSNVQSASEILRGLSPSSGGLAGALATAPDVKALQEQAASQKQINDYLLGQSTLLGQANEQVKEQRVLTELLAQAYDGRLSPAIAQSYNTLLTLRNAPVLGDITKQVAAISEAVGLGDPFAAITRGFESSGAAAQDATSSVEDYANALQYIQGLQQESIDSSVSGLFDSQINAAQAGLDAWKTRINNTSKAAIDGINNAFERASDGIKNHADATIKGLQKQLDALELKPSARTKGLQNQLDALKDEGPSKRTKELTDRINDLTAAQAKQQYQQSLNDVNDAISLERLKQRLALSKDAINLDQYQGKARVIAIDALIDRQQKANEAQARFNQLLDIQYKIQSGVHREQGETIQDFISRRAQYYRGLLEQAAELRQKGPLADLQAEKERVQESIALKELEDKKRGLIEDHARQQYMQSLQDQLAASRDRDQKELESRRESLQKQLEASKKADQDALDARRQALQDRIEAVRDNAAKEIDALQNTRDRAIDAAQKARDMAIAAAEKTTQATIDQLKARADQTAKWTNFANIQALDTAIQGTRSMAQLQSLSGAVSGLEWSMNYLYQTGGLMGMDPAARSALMSNYIHTIQDYMSQVQKLYHNASPPSRLPGGAGGGYAEGGVFWAGNQNTPLRGDVRWGDTNGEELGVMLNNRVMHTLREQGFGKPSFGDVTINRSDDPYRDMAMLRRSVRDVVREELRN